MISSWRNTLKGSVFISIGCTVGIISGILLFGGGDGPVSPSVAPAKESIEKKPDQVRAPRRCGLANFHLSDGDVMPDDITRQVELIHDAACRGDWVALESQMSDIFTSSYGNLTPSDTIREWMGNPAVLNSISAILETQAGGDQGGYTYQLNDTVLVIARTTYSDPESTWSIFVQHCLFSDIDMREHFCPAG